MELKTKNFYVNNYETAYVINASYLIKFSLQAFLTKCSLMKECRTNDKKGLSVQFSAVTSTGKIFFALLVIQRYFYRSDIIKIVVFKVILTAI